MHTQRTRRRIAQEQRLTHYDELEARSTMSRLQLAVDDGEHTDAAAAALGWRQAARACRAPAPPGARERRRARAQPMSGRTIPASVIEVAAELVGLFDRERELALARAIACRRGRSAHRGPIRGGAACDLRSDRP